MIRKTCIRRPSAASVVLSLASLVTAVTPALAARNFGTPPVISGSPTTSVAAGTAYAFQPTVSDPDSKRLKFGIANQPAWATFDAATGRLSGTPGTAYLGTSKLITIKVSDGKTAVSLPEFSITVKSSIIVKVNNPPTIAGMAVTAAQAERPYAFQPTAADVDGDSLSFSVVGKPSWATFDRVTGTLYGTPTAANVGSSGSVLITVSDGTLTATLPAFSITVAPAPARTLTLNWTAPTMNTDGTALNDLAGYVVFYGTASRQYSTSITVPGAASNSVVLEGLQAGTWYFSIKSTNVSGVASDYAGEVAAVL